MINLLWAFAGFGCGLLLMLIWSVHRKRQSPKAGSSLNEELRIMSRKLAHEIRNPLNTMNLHVQLLEEELVTLPAPPASAQRRLQKLQQEIGRLDRILTDYQRYARLPEPQFAQTDMNNLLRDLVEFIEPEAEHRQIKVNSDFKHLPSLQIDANQIRQVLLNLILNAHQAMPEGGELKLRAYAQDDQVKIEVTDTGHGIADSVRERIFEPFFSTREGGTGIGLSMAKHILEHHQGQLICHSIPEQGTTFTVLLPRYRKSS